MKVSSCSSPSKNGDAEQKLADDEEASKVNSECNRVSTPAHLSLSDTLYTPHNERVCHHGIVMNGMYISETT